MLTGRCITPDGATVWFAGTSPDNFQIYDPYTAQMQGKVEIKQYLPPIQPTKIICLGLNYSDHAEEMNMPKPKEPLIFMKPASSIIAHGEAIELPKQSKQVDYEAELAVVIGKRCRKVDEDEAMFHVFGFTCLNDVTARDLQLTDGQWTRAKSFDTFAPIGPWIATSIDPAPLEITCRVNGELKQSSNTKNLIFPVPFIVSYISHIMTLEPGDVIATGTPGGIGPLTAGDTVSIEIEEIGILTNRVV